MQAVVAQRPGTFAEVLALQHVPEPDALADGEVVVRMNVSTVNHSDAVTVSGTYGSRTVFPFVPGFEGVGVIERIGPGVPRSALGMRVLPIGSAGTWQELMRTEHSWCIPVPEDIADTLACFAYINPLTALLLVERSGTAPGSAVAITAATSAIAGHLAELLALAGIRPIGLVRGSPGSLVAAPGLWSTVIDTSAPGWERRLREAAPGGLAAVLDCVGGRLGGRLWEELRPGGMLLHYGLLSGRPLPAECFSGRGGRRTQLVRLRDQVHALPRAELPGLFVPVFAHLREGRLRTRIGREVPLAQLPQALAEPLPARGKILIRYPR
ncbi:zinc-dependent alcohol dehydrogenase family protein [Brachybacterium hainanense]|uniref:Zinc-dependent alcohol dehydrogenase family protein n=1 Tax=Brachybacterium hainanense TaxID=1541174 RepID=A0ABV6R927_9MICO